MKTIENSIPKTLEDQDTTFAQKCIFLEKQLNERDQQITFLNEQIANLKEQIAWFTKQIFGKKSEKSSALQNDEQMILPGLENLETTQTEQQTKEVPAHQRKIPNRDGKDAITLPENLPVETTIIDIPENQKFCPVTKEPLKQLEPEITLKLAHKPGSYYVKKIIRPKYALPKSEGILTAELPECLIPKCRADESLLADILTKKFADHLPLYRIHESLQRDGIHLSRRLLSQWVIRCGLALAPLYEVMKKKILESGYVFIDESPVLLQETGKCMKAYVWVMAGGNPTNSPYRYFQFCQSRAHNFALELLSNYKGVFHSDKYAVYEKIAKKEETMWCPCWAHIRRKFIDAEFGDPAFRAWALRKIKYLYMLEKVAWARSPEERLRIRQELEVPIIDELILKIKGKLLEGRLLPKCKLREALGYFCSLIPYIKNYTKDPFAKIDNNTAERAVRPLAIGRKNWLFFGSPEGGKAGAIILSLVQTCRGLGINPREYLEDVMRRIMGHTANKLHELLPDEWLKNKKS